MNFRHEGDARGGHFFLDGPERTLARLDYHRFDGHLDVVHTEVDASLGGQGVGRALVGAAVAFARTEKLTLDASCPFARRVLERDPSFADVFVRPSPSGRSSR